MSNYDLFFEAIYEMQSQNQISSDEKKSLKSRMVVEDTQVMQIVKLTSKQAIKDKILEILKKVCVTPKKSEIPQYENFIEGSLVSIGSGEEIFRPKSFSQESSEDDVTAEQDCLELEQIILRLQQEKKSFSIFERNNLRKIRKVIENLIEEKINKNKQNYIVQIIKRMQPKIEQQYKLFKESIFLTLRQILQLSVSEMKLAPLIIVMEKILKLTIGCSHFSYIYEKDDKTVVFFDSQKQENKQIQIDFKQLADALESKKYSLFTETQYEGVKDLDLFPRYNQTNYMKIFDENHQSSFVLFIHRVRYGEKGLSQENPLLDSQVQDDYIQELGLLYFQSLQAHKMNLYTPYKFISQYLDIFNFLLDNSVLFFLWELKNQFQEDLNQEIEIEVIQKYQNEDQNSLLFNYLKKTYIINQNTISLEVDYPNNLELVNIFNRYKKYVQRIKNKTKNYKQFIKNQTKLMLDFDKKNTLIFISQPLSVEMRQKFHIPQDMDIFEDSQRFDTIFAKHHKLLEDINQARSKINKKSFQNNFIQSYHIPEIDFYFEYQNHKMRNFNLVINDLDIFYEQVSFSQRLERSLSGINKSYSFNYSDQIDEIDENDNELPEIQQQQIQNKISEAINYNETAKFLNKWQKENPSFKDSQILMFLPEEEVQKKVDQTTKQVKSKIKDERKNKISIKFDTEIFQRKQEDVNFTSLEWDALKCETIEEMHRTVYAILDQGGWIEKLQIEHQVLLDFLQMMEGKYNQRKNTFHNYQHAIAVMQGCYGLAKGTNISNFLSDFEVFAVTFSGFCHDVNHTGRTNIFEVNSLSKLALRYQDQSVLENHHLANTFKCLSIHNVFKNIPDVQFIDLRRIMISNILYTDIKKHFSLLKDFENSFKLNNEDSKLIENTILAVPERVYGKTPEEVRLLAGMVIHSADFNGGAKQFHISRVWSEKVNVEFTAQYEEEFKLGIPQTPFFKDLDKIQVMAKGEIGFYKFIVMPLWSLLNDFLYGEIQKSVNYINGAISEWSKIMDQNQDKENQK